MLVHGSGGRGGLIVVLVVLLLKRELWGQRMILLKRVDWVCKGNLWLVILGSWWWIIMWGWWIIMWGWWIIMCGGEVDETLWKAVVV